MQNNKNKSGVTLTELAVSVAIISLLIAGTFGGVTMLKAAKINKMVLEFTKTMSAINEFQAQYSYLPGDFPTAVNFGIASSGHNGNGDGIIPNSNNEELYVWEHLSKAKLIAGSYDGLYSNDPTNTVRFSTNRNCPGSDSFQIGAFGFSRASASIYNTDGHFLKFSALDSSGEFQTAVMSAKDAYSIDVKMDDGLASSGMLYTIRNSTNCVSAASSAASANYQQSDATVDCRLYYWQKKF